MLKQFAKVTLASAGLLLAASNANAASVNYQQLNLTGSGEIVAIPEDGQTYSKLEFNDVTFSGNVKASMNIGFIQGVAVFAGNCGGALCGSPQFGTLTSEGWAPGKMEIDRNLSFDVSASDFPQGLSANLQAAKIFTSCSSRMKGPGGATDKTYTHYVGVTLKLKLFHLLGAGVDPTYSHTVPVTVRCKARDVADPNTMSDLKFEPGEFKAKGIELFLSTYSNANTTPNAATTCKKGQIKVRLKANKVGLAAFKLWKNVGNASITNETIFAQANPDGDGGFKAEYVEWVSVDKTTNLQVMAEQIDGIFAEKTKWKSITLPCKSVGSGGGLATNPDPKPDTPLGLVSTPPFVEPVAPLKLVPVVPQRAVVGSDVSQIPSAPWQCVGGAYKQGVCKCPAFRKLIYTQVKYHGQLYNGSKCVLSGPGGKTTRPGSSSVDAVDKTKSDAVKRRLEAAKKEKAAFARRKAAADAAIAKRKRDAAIKATLAIAKKKRDAALKVRRLKLRQAVAKRAAALVLARRQAAAITARKAALKKRAAPSSTGTATRMRVMRLR